MAQDARRWRLAPAERLGLAAEGEPISERLRLAQRLLDSQEHVLAGEDEAQVAVALWKRMTDSPAGMDMLTPVRPATRDPRSTPRIRRLGGQLIVSGSVIQLIAAALPDPRVFTSSNPRIQLDAIAARPAGWTAQAVGFPVAFAVTGLGFGAVAATMPGSRSRLPAMVASALSVTSMLLWLPIAAKRLAIGHRVEALLSAEEPVAVDIGGWSFWPYTLATLGSILAMGWALVVSGLHRRLGGFAAGVSGLALLLLPRLRDWPPFLSYLITLAVGVGIAKAESDPLRSSLRSSIT